MALIQCPKCQQTISSVAKSCPHCQHTAAVEELESNEEKIRFLRRRHRDRLFRLRMFSYLAMAVAMAGALPMLWHYIQSAEQGLSVDLWQHRGMWVFVVGCVFYFILRIFIVLAQRQHKMALRTLNSPR